MGFLGLFTPKWRHRDAKVRLAAVAALAGHDDDLLARIALQDSDAGVRLAAVSRIVSPTALRRLLATTDQAVLRIARERVAGVAFREVMTQPLRSCADLLAQIDEQKSLSELTLTARDPAVRAAAFARLCAADEPSQALLATIAIQDGDGAFALAAVARLDKRALLANVAKKAKNAQVQAAATARSGELAVEAERPSPERRRRTRLAELEPLVAQAVRLASAGDPDRALAESADLEARWQAVLAGFADLPLDAAAETGQERFRRAQASLTQRVSLARQEAAALASRIAEREQFLDRLAMIGDGADAAGLRAAWNALGELPIELRRTFELRFVQAMARFAPVVADPSDWRSALATPAAAPVATIEPTAEQAAQLDALCTQSEQLAASDQWRDADYQFKVLHKSWSMLSHDLAHGHPLRQRFLAAYNLFKERRRASRDARDSHDGERLAELERLVRQVEALADDPPAEGALLARQDELKRLQAAWRQVGPLRPERIQPLRTRFRAACDRAFEPLHSLREAADWERFANLAKAEALIAEADALQSIEDLPALAGRIKDIQLTWKRLGPLPRDRQQERWLAFKTICDREYDRCRVHFARLDQERLANLEAKRALLAEVEELAGRGPVGLAGSPADQAARHGIAERIKAIQQEWKATGPVPREHDRELWTRFRAQCDRFFAVHNAGRDQEQAENLRRKEDLCAAVEELAERAESITGAVPADRARWVRQVKDVQAQWRMVGHVPMERKEPVWQRFRAACDRIYDLDRQQRGEMAEPSTGEAPPADGAPLADGTAPAAPGDVADQPVPASAEPPPAG